MVREYSEVFKIVGKRSVRGRVKSCDEVGFSAVFTTVEGNEFTDEFTFEQVGVQVFESEKDLIRVRGTEIVELAPPREIGLKWGYDCYGNPIYEGDSVIAMNGQPLYNKVEGIASKIYMLSSYGFEKMIFVDVANENGDIICERALCNMFTIPNRFVETNR